MITAIVLIGADVASIPEVAEQIAAIDGVTEVYSVTGDVDLIAMVRVREHERLADVIADRINKVPGVLTMRTRSSETSCRIVSSTRCIVSRRSTGAVMRIESALASSSFRVPIA